jgi:phospholipase/carboxylesterase
MRPALVVAAFVAVVIGPGCLDAGDGTPHLGTLKTRNSGGRTGSYYVPAHESGAHLPVLVALHGTGDAGRAMVGAFRDLADARRFVIVAPDSRRSPNGQWTWQVGDKPDDVTEDLRNVVASLDEVADHLGPTVDLTRVLIVGYSGGASAAPYIASNRGPFSAFGVLHGGVFANGLGARHVRGWFSTGARDPARPPVHVKRALEDTRARASGI